MFSSPRSMNASTSSMRMSPSWVRLALATRSRSGGSCSTRFLSSISVLQITDGAYHARRLLHDLLLGQGTLLDPPEGQLGDQADQGSRADLAWPFGVREVNEPARDVHVQVAEGRVCLEGLAQEGPIEWGLLLDEVEVGADTGRLRVVRLPGHEEPALQIGGRGVDQLLEELPLALEMVVEERLGHTGRGGDVPGRGRVVAGLS